MKNAINRAFQISKGLAGLAGKKLKSAILELEKEGVITKQEGQRVLSEIGKVKKMVDSSVVAPLKKLVAKAKAKKSAKAKAKKRA